MVSDAEWVMVGNASYFDVACDEGSWWHVVLALSSQHQRVRQLAHQDLDCCDYYGMVNWNWAVACRNPIKDVPIMMMYISYF